MNTVTYLKILNFKAIFQSKYLLICFLILYVSITENYAQQKNSKSTVKTAELKPTQSQFNPEKISNMNSVAKSMPILVSKDNYVLDGHHRWLANHYDSGLQDIIRLPWDAPTSLKTMHDYEKTFTKSIHEDGAAAVSIGGGAMDNTVTPKKRKKTFNEWRNDHVAD